MTSWWVRPATPRDRTAIRDLSRRTRRERPAGPRAPIRGTGWQGEEKSWVVEAGKREIVGCATVRELNNGDWELVEVALIAAWRGFGLGRALVDHAARTVRDSGGLALIVTSPALLAGGDGMAHGLGFEIDEAGGTISYRRGVAYVS